MGSPASCAISVSECSLPSVTPGLGGIAGHRSLLVIAERAGRNPAGDRFRIDNTFERSEASASCLENHPENVWSIPDPRV
jgi:hypothetical protein